MDRRLLLAALAGWPAVRLLAQDAPARPRHKVSAAELHEALSARFPVRAGLAGLLAVEVSAPRLLLLPARQKLGATLVAQLASTQGQQLPSGELDLVFALRYERADQTLRAHDPEVLALRWPGMPPETAQALRGLLPSMAREAVGELVLHSFTAKELALPDTMGFEPERAVVVDDGLVMEFGPKRRP